MSAPRFVPEGGIVGPFRVVVSLHNGSIYKGGDFSFLRKICLALFKCQRLLPLAEIELSGDFGMVVPFDGKKPENFFARFGKHVDDPAKVIGIKRLGGSGLGGAVPVSNFQGRPFFLAAKLINCAVEHQPLDPAFQAAFPTKLVEFLKNLHHAAIE